MQRDLAANAGGGAWSTLVALAFVPVDVRFLRLGVARSLTRIARGDAAAPVRTPADLGS